MKSKIFLLQFISVIIFTITISWDVAFGKSLSGIVLDANESPLPNMNITIPALQRGTTTDAAGTFTLEKLPAGIYTVEFALIGYRTETRTIDVSAGDVALAVVMSISPLKFPAITLSAKPQPTDILTSPQSVSVVKGRQLDRQRGQSIIESIENTAGVSTYSTGAGIVKPAIRGLTSQRILVVVDGVRQEGQQWGDEHSPEIDAFDVGRIEVVRGPNSVLYGSDALGGVINITKASIPAQSVPLLGGKFMLNGFSNNRQGAGALALYGVKGVIGYRANLSVRTAGDISTPAGRLFNSGIQEFNGSSMLGIKGNWGSAALDYSRVEQEFQIHENPAEEPGATPFQSIHHDKVHLAANFPLERFRLEVDGAWQRNDRKEFEEKEATVPELNLVLETATLDVKAHHYPVGPVFGTIGFSLMQQNNKTLAEEALIPAFDLLNIAGFVYEELSLSNLSLSAGLRFDSRKLDVSANSGLGVETQVRRYNAVSGSVGMVWRATNPLAFAVNLGRAWRAPTAFELFVDGVHEGTVRYEIGDNTLEPEASVNVDLAVRYASTRLQGELAFFRNQINRYIFLNPTGEVDAESGFREYQHLQTDATLIGAEFTVQAQIMDWLILKSGADIVRGEKSNDNNPLPLVPANRFKLGLHLSKSSLARFSNPYVSVDAKVVAAQNRVEEFETKTKGYTLFGIGIGGEIPLDSSNINIDLSVKNLLNKAYRDHLSRYKEYALNPGRNVTLKVSVPFGIIK